MKYPDGRSTSLSAAGGKICSTVTAEMKALTRAAAHLVNTNTPGNIVILTDSMTTLQVLSSTKNSDAGTHKGYTTVYTYSQETPI